MTREELMNVLCRYEGAIENLNDDHTAENMLEMAAAREELMDVLLAAKKETT
jgi:hypothetical protein